jgi:hypothetical protein
MIKYRIEKNGCDVWMNAYGTEGLITSVRVVDRICFTPYKSYKIDNLDRGIK